MPLAWRQFQRFPKERQPPRKSSTAAEPKKRRTSSGVRFFVFMACRRRSRQECGFFYCGAISTGSSRRAFDVPYILAMSASCKICEQLKCRLSAMFDNHKGRETFFLTDFVSVAARYFRVSALMSESSSSFPQEIFACCVGFGKSGVTRSSANARCVFEPAETEFVQNIQ